MAAWVTVYLRRAPPALTPKAIDDGIGAADWWTLGEQYDLDEDEVDAFLDGLQWQADPLTVGVEGQRPIQLYVRTDPAQIRTELTELYEIDEIVVPAAERERLESICAIVSLELGSSQLETMLEALAFEIAYWLASSGDGVIRGPDDRFHDAGAHRWEPFTD